MQRKSREKLKVQPEVPGRSKLQNAPTFAILGALESEMEKGTQEVEVCGEQLVLLPERAVWWPARKSLLVADVHLGKAGHFRKAGIPVSQQVHETDTQRLRQLISRYRPQRLFFLGDLFHSYANRGWKLLEQLYAQHPQVQYILVRGNHELLPDKHYTHFRLQVVQEWEEGPFRLQHEPPVREEERFVLCGHVHPGVRLAGQGHESLKLPCFYFAPHFAMLPAFGCFTGLGLVRPKVGEAVYPIAERQVLRYEL